MKIIATKILNCTLKKLTPKKNPGYTTVISLDSTRVSALVATLLRSANRKYPSTCYAKPPHVGHRVKTKICNNNHKY
jgi:hypothetical protein